MTGVSRISACVAAMATGCFYIANCAPWLDTLRALSAGRVAARVNDGAGHGDFGWSAECNRRADAPCFSEDGTSARRGNRQAGRGAAAAYQARTGSTGHAGPRHRAARWIASSRAAAPALVCKSDGAGRAWPLAGGTHPLPPKDRIEASALGDPCATRTLFPVKFFANSHKGPSLFSANNARAGAAAHPDHLNRQTLRASRAGSLAHA